MKNRSVLITTFFVSARHTSIVFVDINGGWLDKRHGSDCGGCGRMRGERLLAIKMLGETKRRELKRLLSPVFKSELESVFTCSIKQKKKKSLS